MIFTAVIMISSIVFWQKIRVSVRKNYYPASIQRRLTFFIVILLDRPGKINVRNVSIWNTHSLTTSYFTILIA